MSVEMTWAVIGLLAAISFGQIWFLGARIESLSARMEAGFAAINARLDGISARIDNHITNHPT